MKSAIDEITLFIDSSSYSYEFSRMEISNNIFGVEIYKYKIINFPHKNITGVIIESFLLNSELSINDEIDINDTLIFKRNQPQDNIFLNLLQL